MILCSMPECQTTAGCKCGNRYPEAKARERETLERQIMDPCIAKNDAEWWAMREIEKLRAEVNRLRPIVYGLQAGGDLAKYRIIAQSVE